MVGLAVLMVVLPEVGPNRFWLAGLLTFVMAPIAWLLNRVISAETASWAEPLFDLCLVVSLVHLVPLVWFPALCIGILVALAPSVALHPRSNRIYAGYAAVLILGMSFAALVHDVQDWLTSILAISAIYPSLIFYSHIQTRRAEELRQRLQMLQSLAQVAGGVAHDFNNLLMGVSGHAELALLDLPSEHPARGAVNEILKGAKRATLLSRRLLEFSGRGVGVMRSLDLASELDIIVRLIRPLISEKTKIDCRLPSGAVYVRTDKEQLQRIIMNAVLNAAGSSTGSPARVELYLREENRSGSEWVILSIRSRVSDEKTGGHPKLLDPVILAKERGRDLGLRRVRRALGAYGGSIEVNVDAGGETELCLLLPSAGLSEIGVVTVESVSMHGGRALVIDDEPQVRDVLRGFLEHLEFEVETAADADAGIRSFIRERGRYAVVLLDLKMPGKDGWQCLKELRAVRADIPVVICSGYDPEAGDETLSADLGLRFLSKPFSLFELKSAIEAVKLDSSRYSRGAA